VPINIEKPEADGSNVKDPENQYSDRSEKKERALPFLLLYSDLTNYL